LDIFNLHKGEKTRIISGVFYDKIGIKKGLFCIQILNYNIKFMYGQKLYINLNIKAHTVIFVCAFYFNGGENYKGYIQIL
jgi:hypothetical protein